MDLAPIVLFVYNRPWHTGQCLESLMNNDLSCESELFIYADGPKKSATPEQLQKIKEVRQVIRAKKWCREVRIIERDKNWGLSNSVIEGVTENVNKYGKIIVLEDDLLLAKGFLRYMNDGLNFFADTEKIYGCTGYIEPLNYQHRSVFFHRKGASWGWGTWSRVWKNFVSDADFYLKQFLTVKQIKKFNVGGYPFYEMLKSQQQKKIDSWAICFYAYSFLNDGLWLMPTQSLVKNIGFDFSGVHCKNDHSFVGEICNEEIFIKSPIKIEENKFLNEKREKFYRQEIRPSFLSRLSSIYKSFFFN